MLVPRAAALGRAMLPASRKQKRRGTMNIDLNVFDLQKDLAGTLTLESVDAAKAWLEDRPKFIQVLGVASRDLSKELDNELRACMRALDEDEKRLKAQSAKKAEEAARERAEAMRKEGAEQHRVEMAAADPSRPMEVSYRFNAELSLADVADLREITPEARQATLEWVKERNTWIERRGQVVGSANVKVWPGAIPEGESERVVMGTFVPVIRSEDDA